MDILKRKWCGFEVDLLVRSVLHPWDFLLFVFLPSSASDSARLARNFSRATLNFEQELHGVNTYICEAKNKHGLTRIFMTVLIPGVYRSLASPHSLLFLVLDNQTKPLLSFSEVQSRSVLLSWRVSNGRYDRFNHFIIYYRRLQNSEETYAEVHGRIHAEDYKQVLVDPRTTQFSFTFRVKWKELFSFDRRDFFFRWWISPPIPSMNSSWKDLLVLHRRPIPTQSASEPRKPCPIKSKMCTATCGMTRPSSFIGHPSTPPTDRTS